MIWYVLTSEINFAGFEVEVETENQIGTFLWTKIHFISMFFSNLSIYGFFFFF